MAGLSLLAACSELRDDLQPGICGNHVVEANEDCDDNSPSCGQPGTAQACRSICPTGSCQQGFCGTAGPSQGVCLVPSSASSYTLSPPVGDPANQFQLLTTANGQFLAERTPQSLVLYQNQGGQFQRLGSGPVSQPLFAPDTAVYHPPDLAIRAGRLKGDDVPSLVVKTNGSTDLLSLTPGQLHPLLVSSVALDNGGNQLGYQGTVVISPQLAAEPLFYDSAQNALVSYDVSGDTVSFQNGQPQPHVQIALQSCGTGLSSVSDPTGGTQPSVVIGPPRRTTDTSVIAVVMDTASGAQQVCALVASTAASVPVVKLALPSALASAQLFSPQIADLNGDHLLDVTVLAVDPKTSNPDRVSWLQTSPGVFSSPVEHAPDAATPFIVGPFAVGDLNGDGADDFYGAAMGQQHDSIFLNRQLGSASGTFSSPIFFETGFDFLSDVFATGDVDKSGTQDLVITPGTVTDQAMRTIYFGEYSICLTEATSQPTQPLRLTCSVQESGLTSISKLLVGDVNGDALNDVIAFFNGDATRNLASGVSILPGPVVGASPTATVIDGYHAPLVDVALSPPVGFFGPIANGLLATLELDQKFGFNLGAASGGQMTFSLPGVISDHGFFDADGDGIVDLVEVDDFGVLYHSGQSAGGLQPALEAFFPNEVSPLAPRFVQVNGESQPAIVWALNQSSADSLSPSCAAGDSCVFIARRNGTRYQVSVASFSSVAGLSGFSFDVDGLNGDSNNNAQAGEWELDDLDGDGFPELVAVALGTAANGTSAAKLVQVHFSAGAAPAITVAATLPGSTSQYFITSNPTGGRQLYLTSTDGAGTEHVQRATLSGGVFDMTQAESDPVVFSNVNQPLDSSFVSLGHLDLNGDGIEDLVFFTPAGVRVALADSQTIAQSRSNP